MRLHPNPAPLSRGPALELLGELAYRGWRPVAGRSEADRLLIGELLEVGYLEQRARRLGGGRGVVTWLPHPDGSVEVSTTGIGDAEVEHARADGRLPDNTTNQNPIATPPLSDGRAIAVVL